MDILPVNFKVLRFCGAWNEGRHSNSIVRLFNFLYRYTIFALIYHFAISEILELLFVLDDIEDLTEGLFMTLTFVALCFKYGNFLARQSEVSELLNGFRSPHCRGRDSVEQKIIDKYDRKAKWCAYTFMCLSQATGVALLTAPVFMLHRMDRPLPLKMYLPYSVKELGPYLATYFQQIAALSYGILLNVSFDSMVYGFSVKTCGQIQLLRHRLTEVFEKANFESTGRTRSARDELFKNCVQHHLLIHVLVQRIRSLFVWIVTLLFFFSLITLCTSIFRMSKNSIFSAEFLSLFLYTECMTVQIFFYCWYGNELQLMSKSIGDAVYLSNWTAATWQERKNLLLVMTISQKGLTLSYYGVFALAISTFTWIMKTSYSAFNLLQQASD